MAQMPIDKTVSCLLTIHKPPISTQFIWRQRQEKRLPDDKKYRTRNTNWEKKNALNTDKYT